MPNLALMKLSAWHKKHGDEVVLIDLSGFDFDKLYGSQIFMGGSGYDLSSELPEGIEHIRPDYELFKTDFSMGFTSRGCVRNCKFCIVREKEGFIREHSALSEFVDDSHHKGIIMDSNFMASSECISKLQQIAAKKWKVNFNQGIDVRIMTDEKCELLSQVKYYDWKFKNRRLHIAWDLMDQSVAVVQGIERLLRYIPARHIMCYVLVGFDTDISSDLARIEKLDAYGVKPFVMIYENRRDKPILRHLARWVNQRYYEFLSFEEYLERRYPKGLEELKR